MSNKNYLQEFKRFSGIIQESDDYGMITNIIPGLENAESMCSEAVQELQAVLERLRKLQSTLQSENNNLNVQAESHWLSGKLRTALHNVLACEKPLLKAISEMNRY